MQPTDYSYLTPLENLKQAEEKPKPERILKINRILKERLLLFRVQLLKMVVKIDEQYRKNNIFLEQAKHGGPKDSASFKTSYMKCGSPFFKNALGETAPFNEDYKHRKNVLKEFFPFDVPITSSRWKTKEKVALLNGVKAQMISHIKSQQSRKLCQDVRKTRGRFQKMKFISQNKDLEKSAMIEIYNEIGKDYPDFSINWNLISFNQLQSNHSVSECMGMWFSYLRPDINHDPFTDEENSVMARNLAENNHRSWNEIVAKLNRRSSLQAFVHFNTTFGRVCPSNVRWTAEEDTKLFESIEKYSVNGVINWAKVGQVIPTRNKTQCYNRHLITVRSPCIKKGVFTKQENRILLDYMKEFGEIGLSKLPSMLLPGRSTSQIRNHYNIALKHKGNIFPWTRDEDKLLMEHVNKSGTNDWRKIASVLKTHNRLSCRTRFTTISKFLVKNPGKTIQDVPCKTKRVTAVQRAAASSDSDEGNATSSKTNLPQPKEIGLLTVSRFQKQSAELFKIMKTTFNYDFSNREIPADNTKLLVLKRLFKVDENKCLTKRAYMFTMRQLIKLREVMSFKLSSKLLGEMKFAMTHTQFLMPPNYNTAVGLRALTIKMHEDPLDQEDIPTITNPSTEYRLELENFQKYFFSLFYWSAMLNRLDPNELNEIHFMKYPKAAMNAHDIFRQLKTRHLPISAGFNELKRSAGSSKTYPAKKPRT